MGARARSKACGSFSPVLSPKKRSRPVAWSASSPVRNSRRNSLPSTWTGSRKAGPRGDPARAVERDPAAGHDHVDVRMVGQGRAPGVEHGRDADAGAEVARVGCDRQHRLRRGPEQQVVDRGLVGEGDVGDLGRHREHHVEVAHGQQVRLARCQPLARGSTLALGAVPVAAGVVGDAGVATALAAPRRGRRAPRCGRSRMADITLSWPRLTMAGVAARQAAPCRRKMSAISSAGRAMAPAHQARLSAPSIGRLRRSSGLVHRLDRVQVATRA